MKSALLKKQRYFAYFLTAIFTVTAMILCFNVGVKETLLFSISYYGIFYFIALFITAKPLKSLNIASVFYVVLYGIHRIKIHFYKEALFFSDFYVMSDHNNWGTLLHYKESWILVIFFALILFSLFAYRKNSKVRWNIRVLSFCLVVLFIGLNVYLAQNKKIRDTWLATLPGAKETFMNFTMSVASIKFEKPVYDINNSFNSIVTKTNHVTEHKDISPNIILWLQESTLDVNLLSNLLDKPDMFKPANNLKASSLLRVHTYGGRTYRSEFGILSGINPGYFNENTDAVFYTVTKHLKYSLPKLLKMKGYTTIVLSPFNGGSYNAEKAYKDLGIDIYYQPQDFGYPAKKSANLWHISSQEMANYAEKVLEKHKNDGPIFLYMLTMSEHGPYDENHAIINQLDTQFSSKTASKLSDYATRQYALDKATVGFDEYLNKTGQEYVFAYFGDHQGAIDNITIDLKQAEVESPYYMTQIFIRGSQNIQEVKLNKINDVSLLGGVILEMAGIEPDIFFRANITMRKICEGVIDECKNKNIKEGYISYVFNTLDAAGN